MPSGKVHDITSIIAIPLIVLVGIYIGLSGNIIVISLFGFIFGSFMFNGDLDVKSKPYHRWSIFKSIWKPYQQVFSHRSIFTHGYIIGTIIRIFYFMLVLSPIFIILDVNIINLIKTHEFIAVCVGLEIGAALHSTLDYIF